MDLVGKETSRIPEVHTVLGKSSSEVTITPIGSQRGQRFVGAQGGASCSKANIREQRF